MQYEKSECNAMQSKQGSKIMHSSEIANQILERSPTETRVNCVVARQTFDKTPNVTQPSPRHYTAGLLKSA